MADVRTPPSARRPGRAGADLLSSGVRRRIVEHLDSLPRVATGGRPGRDQGLTAAELADVLGLHVTTARFHLDQLLAAGLLDSHFVRRGGAGRPAKKYLPAGGDLGEAAGGQAPPGEPYQVLATLLTTSVVAGEEDGLSPEEAGRQWVRQRTAAAAPAAQGEDVDRRLRTAVVDLLREWGYHAELSDGPRESELVVTLRDCPFLELARAHPAVVCGIHRGLLRGVLETAGELDADVSLRPFIDARTCQAVLTRHRQPAPEQQRSIR